MRKYLFIIYISLVHISVFAQEVLVKSELDSSKIYIGDQATYTVTLTQDPGINLRLPVFADTLFDKIEIISQTEIDSSFSDDGKLILQKKYLISSFDTGFYQIPPYSVEHADDKGIRRYYSDYVPLEVVRVDISPGDSTDVIFDIIQPGRIGIGLNEILPWVLAGVALVIGIWLLVRYLRRKRKSVDDSVAEMPSEPIHIIAFRDFDKLEKKELWQKGRVKEYYSSLTEILRVYIQRRYYIPAPEMTSGEIIYSLEISGFNDIDLKKTLKDILINADLSKFAKYRHDSTTNIKSLSGAREYVRATFKREDEQNDESVSRSDNINGKEETNE